MPNNKKTSVIAPEVTTEPKSKLQSVTGKVRKATVTALIIVAIVIFGSIAFITALAVMANMRNIKNSEIEFEELRETAAKIKIEDHEEFGTIHLGQLDEEMLKINSDYICWIRIDGTNIDYPVVRGLDNEMYLNTSFRGEKSITGTVFMDYRIYGNLLADRTDEIIPHIIIYGHNLRQGGIFTDLRKLLNNQFLEENNIVKLIVNDQVIEYEIFSVRRSDIEDPAYHLNFDASNSFPRFANKIDAPLRATQILTLSTCVTSNNDDDRLIVQAYRLMS